MQCETSGTLYELIGGMDACRKLSRAFYARVEEDPVVRPLYPSSLHCVVESLALSIAQYFGGPNDYSRQRPSLSLTETHARFRIGLAERDAWLQDMNGALDDVQVSEPAKSAAREFFTRASAYLVNHPTALPNDGQTSDSAVLHIWDFQRTLDEIVAAIRNGDADRALSLAESPRMASYFGNDRAGLAGLLAIMGVRREVSLLDFVRGQLVEDPRLVTDGYRAGRRLLHDAAGGGNLAFVEMLLGLGADPNAVDKFGHTPLYFAGNQEGEGDVVRALVRAGADVDAQDSVKECTALHMAARQGNVGVAEALLDHGANLEVRDRQGETPLRRAVNCGKSEVAAFLLSRGADVQSKGSRRLTPWQAARGNAMKQALRPYVREREGSDPYNTSQKS